LISSKREVCAPGDQKKPAVLHYGFPIRLNSLDEVWS